MSQAGLKDLRRINYSLLKVLFDEKVQPVGSLPGRGACRNWPIVRREDRRPECASLSKEKLMTMISNTPCLATTASVIRRRFAILLARLGRLIHRGVAVMIASRERQAALVARRHLNRHKPKDIGIYRYRIGEVRPETAESRTRLKRQR
jgi:hypothetical protein